MSDKILTISVAAYNVEKYLRHTLDSLIVDEISEDIEVIVVDDGGQDGSYEIAKEYERKYPDTFRAVHKENGGYGSTVNYSIKHAQGKYFKLLDGDDWYDKEGLVKLVNTLKNIDVDAVFTQFIIEKQGKEIPAIKFSEQIVNRIIGIEEFRFNAAVPMHSITYKTNILRESNIKLPEHMLYTDNIYIAEPFIYVRDVYCENYSVYYYRVGVDGQSVNKKSLIKHINESKDISILLTKFYETKKDKELSSIDYIEMNVAATCVNCIVGYLAMQPSLKVLKSIIEFDNEICKISSAIYKRMIMLDRKASRILKVIRNTKYLFYWVVAVKNFFD